MMQPKESDIEAAKAYLRLRLEAELSMSYNLELIMREAAERFVDICYKANISPDHISFDKLPVNVRMQLEEVIAWLRETIDDYFLTLAIYDHEDTRDLILPLILGRNHGMTFAERLEDYCSKYRDELLLLISAGLFLGLSKSALSKSIGEHLKKPYNNPALADGIASPLTYGRGHSNSMFTAISGLTRFGIAQAWMKNKYIEDRKDGCIGWVVQRGSTVPCDICDSMVGFHTDESELPLYHLSCCCIAIPIYSNRDPKLL